MQLRTQRGPLAWGLTSSSWCPATGRLSPCPNPVVRKPSWCSPGASATCLSLFNKRSSLLLENLRNGIFPIFRSQFATPLLGYEDSPAPFSCLNLIPLKRSYLGFLLKLFISWVWWIFNLFWILNFDKDLDFISFILISLQWVFPISVSGDFLPLYLELTFLLNFCGPSL